MDDLAKVAEKCKSGHLRAMTLVVVCVPRRVARVTVGGVQRWREQRVSLIDARIHQASGGRVGACGLQALHDVVDPCCLICGWLHRQELS